MSQTVTQIICHIVADALEIEGEVLPEHHFVNDLGANSLDVVEFVVRLEEHFDIEIPDDAADSIQTVGDLIGYVERLRIGTSSVEQAVESVAVLGYDHAGFAMAQALARVISSKGYVVQDMGAGSGEKADYPDSAMAVATAVAAGDAKLGVLVCGTGIGMAIAANKIPGIRATTLHSTFEAEMSRRHNDANVACFGARVLGEGEAISALGTFIDSEFDRGDDGRHERRVDMIGAIEATFTK